MAIDNNDISDIVKKCKILLLDIEGTTTSISFVKEKLFPYAEENVKDFLETQWETEGVKEAVAALRKLAIEDQEKSLDGVVAIPGEDAAKEDQIEGLVKSVKWQMSSDRKVGALKNLQGLIWKRGYDKGEIKGHVYDDVAPGIELWRSLEGRKVYIYSSGSVAAQKLLFGLSAAGDLLPSIDGHFDTAVGGKQEAASYAAIAEKIGCKPDEILFLTDILKEAEAARESGLHAALVSREGNAPLAAGAAAFPLLHSLAQLANTNKRKPDPQDEQPAKVPKTDIDADVKSNSDTEKSSESMSKKLDEPEKMEVEEEVATKGQPKKLASADKPVEKVETIVEDVTDMNDVKDTPVCDIEPIIEESVDKTDQKETEKMETEPSEIVDSVTKPKDEIKVQNGDKTSVAEETPPTVITEISDITNDKEGLSEAAEIIDDIEPVVEEPPVAQDMEDLQNVGEVLEKECDEILSKVQDVTNLDNIPLKPLLNTIAEETMETENTDTNDIVEGILDSEQERDMKECGDIDLNTVEAITDAKADLEEGQGDKIVATADKPKVVEANTAEKVEETKEEVKEDVTKELKIKDTEKDMDCATEEVKKGDTEKVKESAADKIDKSTTENVKESAAEKVKESSAEKVKVVTSAKVEEKAETMATDSIVEEANATEQKANESSSTETQATESNATIVEKTKKQEEKIETEQNKKENEESKAELKESKIETDSKMADVKTSPVEPEVSSEPEISKVDKEESKAKTEDAAPAKVETKSVSTVETAENKTEEKEIKEPPMETEQSQVEIKVTPAGESTMETDAPAESKENEGAVEVKTDDAEAKVNGKTNGDAEMTDLNGDASKDEELSSRLSMENGKEVNGANGDSVKADQGQSQSSAELEHPDIKVKTVATDEPRTDPIEQPTEA